MRVGCYNTNVYAIFNVTILYIMTTFRKYRHKYKSLMKKDKGGSKNKNRHGGKNKKHRMTHKIKTSRHQINKYRNSRNSRNKVKGLVSRKKSGRARFTKKRKSNILQKGGKPKKDAGKTKSKKDDTKSGSSADNSSEEDSEEEKPPGFMKRRKMGYCIDTKNSVDGKENTCPNKHTGTITSTASSVWAGIKSAGSNLLKMMNPYAAVASKAMEKTMELQQVQIDAKNSEVDLNGAKAAEARASVSSGAMGMAKKMAMKTPQGRALAMAQKATGVPGIPGMTGETGETDKTDETDKTGKTGKTDKS